MFTHRANTDYTQQSFDRIIKFVRNNKNSFDKSDV